MINVYRYRKGKAKNENFGSEKNKKFGSKTNYYLFSNLLY